MVVGRSAVEAVAVTAEFWRGRRVLVTGHTGFKGSWLALWLQELGAQVAGLALPAPTSPSLFDAARVGDGMASVECDIRDAAALARRIREHRPEVVFHLAAQSLVRDSYVQPLETLAVNVMGTAHLLEAVRACPETRAVVVATSDKCYDNREWPWAYREVDPLGGRDPYSASKACAELVCAAWRASFHRGRGGGVALATVRAGNVIGGGDWAADRLLPDAMRAFASGRPLRLRNPGSLRPWQHVLDALAGYLQLAERLHEGRGEWGQAWNFGPDERDTKPVSWLAQRAAELWGEGAGWEFDDVEHPPEAGVLRVDSSRARSLLGWSPRLPLDEAMEWTVGWYRDYHAGKDAAALSRQHVRQYLERLAP